jgi:hypothetical protein
MTHHDDLQQLLGTDYNLLSKEELMNHITDMLELIDKSIVKMQEEYEHDDYSHNFKQTFKYILKHHNYTYTHQDIQLKRDLIVHYRDMIHADVVVLGKHVTELLEHHILDRELLQHTQAKINKLNTDIAHLSAVATVLRESIQE